EAEAVARGLRRDALREILGQEPLRSRAAVADAAGGGDRWEENVREGVARRPGSGSGVVERLAVGGIMLAGDRDGISQRERGRSGPLLGGSERRAHDQPGGQQHVSHENPWNRFVRRTLYAPMPCGVSSSDTCGV